LILGELLLLFGIDPLFLRGGFDALMQDGIRWIGPARPSDMSRTPTGTPVSLIVVNKRSLTAHQATVSFAYALGSRTRIKYLPTAVPT